MAIIRLCFILLGSLLLPNLGYSLSASFPKTDSVIQAQVQDIVSKDSALAPFPIKISVNNAVVSLEAVLPKQRFANTLIIDALSVAGVQSLDLSGLSLAKDPLSADAVINSEVIGTFFREGLMGPLSVTPITVNKTGVGQATYTLPAPPISIDVKTRDGVVYLMGSVPDQATADKAESLAHSIPGVSDVQSSLKVAQ